MSKAMEVGHINMDMFEIIKNPQRETKVYLPVEMDDGTVKVFEGYRIQHSNIRGPFKGGNAAKIFYHREAVIVALSDVSGGIYCENGLDADAVSAYVENGGMLKDYSALGTIHISNVEILTCDCDVLIPAALENQINEEIAARLKCRYVIEGANGPTTESGDAVLEQRGITLIPDIFANSGGVIVSYFEWVQNIQTLTWEKTQVNDMLENIMTKAFQDIQIERAKSNCSYRMAAYVIALRRLIHAEEIKGIFP